MLFYDFIVNLLLQISSIVNLAKLHLNQSPVGGPGVHIFAFNRHISLLPTWEDFINGSLFFSGEIAIIYHSLHLWSHLREFSEVVIALASAETHGISNWMLYLCLGLVKTLYVHLNMSPGKVMLAKVI